MEWRRLSVSPLADPAGGALWRAEVVTASREVDAVRRAQESSLADFLDLLPVGFFSADGDGRLRYANQTLADWLGAGAGEMAGRPLGGFLAPRAPPPAPHQAPRPVARRPPGGRASAGGEGSLGRSPRWRMTKPITSATALKCSGGISSSSSTLA